MKKLPPLLLLLSSFGLTAALANSSLQPNAAALPAGVSNQPNTFVTTAPAPAPTLAYIPAGTDVVVSLRSTVSTASARPGAKFDAHLVSDLRLGDQMLAPQGSLVRGTVTEVQKPGRLNSSATLGVTLDAVLVDGRIVPLPTNPLQAATGPDGAVVRGAVRGAIIADLAGAKAKNGAGAGAALGALKKGQDISYASGTLLTFRLAAPVPIS